MRNVSTQWDSFASRLVNVIGSLIGLVRGLAFQENKLPSRKGTYAYMTDILPANTLAFLSSKVSCANSGSSLIDTLYLGRRVARMATPSVSKNLQGTGQIKSESSWMGLKITFFPGMPGHLERTARKRPSANHP